MEFRATLINEMSGPGAEATATMVSLSASIRDADAAMKLFESTSSSAATGLAGLRAYKGAAGDAAKSSAQLAAISAKGEQARILQEAKASAALTALAAKGEQARAIAEMKASAALTASREKMAGADLAQKNKAIAALILAQAKGSEAAAKAGSPKAGAKDKDKPNAADKATAAAAKLAEREAKVKEKLLAKTAKDAEKEVKDKAKALEKAAKDQQKSAAKELAEKGKLAKAAEKDDAASTKRLENLKAGLGRGAAAFLALGVAAASSGIAMGLPLALGYKGMAKLQMLSARATLDIRKLFSGVNPAPVIRAAEKFITLFSKTTSTGRVLSDIIGRIFNGLFGFIEAAQPYVTAFAQGMIYGFLVVENAVLKVRIAAIPFLGSLNSMVSTGQLMKVAFYGGAVVLGLVAVAAVAAAAPFIALGLAIEKVIGLYNEWSGNTVTLKKAPKGGAGPTATGPDAAKNAAPSVAAAGLSGQSAGSAMAAGLVKGIVAGAPAAAAAGALLAKSADVGVRTEAEIKSPSRKMRRNAGYMTAGAVLGFKDGQKDVQEAAANSLVPDLGKSSPGGAIKAPASAGREGLTINFNAPVGGPVADFEAAVRRVMTGEVRDAAMALGVKVIT